MKEIFNQYLKENSKLTDEEREKILNSFQYKSLNKNDYLVKSGEICNHLSFIQSGILRVFNEIDEEETTLDFVFNFNISNSTNNEINDELVCTAGLHENK